jgi:hypothetical protein
MARISNALGTLMLFLVVVACAGLLLVLPRRAPLQEMPPLVLPAGAVRDALAAEAKAAQQAPRTAAASELDRLWLELSRAEREGPEPMHVRRMRRNAAREAFLQVVKESGEPGALALRAAAVERLDAALDLKLDPKVARDVMGDFALLLEKESCARDGELIAPRVVVRILYKARWNIAHELAPDYAFGSIERRAYYGWQALHAERLPVEQRMRALVQYRRHGGTRADEAAAVLLQRSAQNEVAHAALTAAYRSSGTLRLRNALLAMSEAPSTQEELTP